MFQLSTGLHFLTLNNGQKHCFSLHISTYDQERDQGKINTGNPKETNSLSESESESV